MYWYVPDLNSFTFNTLRPRQNRYHFEDDIFKDIFLNENVWILLEISLKFVSRCLVNNIPSLVQIMACRLVSTKPLSELMMINLLMHICVTRSQWVNFDEIWLCVQTTTQLFIYQMVIHWLGTDIRSWWCCLKGKNDDSEVAFEPSPHQLIQHVNIISGILEACPYPEVVLGTAAR